MQQRSVLTPLFHLFAVQVVITALVIGCGDAISPVWRVVAHTLAAATSSRLLGDTLPWQIVNAAIPVTLLALTTFEVSATVVALPCLITLSLFLPSWWNQAPFYPTRHHDIARVADLFPTNRSFRLIDCGSGFGVTLFSFARKFPNSTFVGIELSPLPYLVAKVRSVFYPGVKIRFGSFWNISLSNYDVIYVFLSPEVTEQLADKVARELSPDCTLISCAFRLPMSSTTHLEETQYSDEIGEDIFVYRR